MNFNVIKSTIFILIAGIEKDLRDFIVKYFSSVNYKELINHNVLNSSIERMEGLLDVSSNDNSIKHILLYTDFADLFQTINTNKHRLTPELGSYFKALTKDLERLTKIRNRIAHNRPLEYDDLATITNFVEQNIKKESDIWKELKEITTQLREDPNYLLNIDYKFLNVREQDSITNNLPIPDFDETGYIGRKDEISELKRLLLGPYPVISVVAEGGLGKTALALKVAYDFLEEPTGFDAIIWSSSKTTKLTNQEIQEITGAITTSIGLFDFISEQLNGQNSNDPFSEIIEYLREFKILLIIDNLETILDDNIRNFLKSLPVGGSKILITSRIGIGAYEFPYKLSKMSDKESVNMLRILSKLRKVNSVVEYSDEILTSYCKKMFNNPLFIKVFVSMIQIGKRPEDILANPDVFLDFCMSNVYDYLDDGAKTLLDIMQSIPEDLNQTALKYYSDSSIELLQKYISSLLTTNMIIMESNPINHTESRYSLTEIARIYLSKHHQIDIETHARILKKRRQYIATTEELETEQRNKYSFYSFSPRSKSDIIICKLLVSALNAGFKSQRFKEAMKLIEEAKQLAPQYFEVYRIEAILFSKNKQPQKAKESYLIAIDLEPNSPQLRTWYGGFLLRCLDDAIGAIDSFKIAIELDDLAFYPNYEILRAYLNISNFSEADKIIAKLNISTFQSDLDRRKYYDLLLQYYTRLTEHYYQKRSDYDKVVINLEMIRHTFNKIPTSAIDYKIHKTLMKTVALIKKIYDKSLNDDTFSCEMKAVVESCFHWIMDISDSNSFMESDFSIDLAEKKADFNKKTAYLFQDKEFEQLNSLQVGQKVFGKVRAFKEYGVFITINETLTGLLHKENINGFLINPNLKELFSHNEEINIEISSIEIEKRRIIFKYNHPISAEWNKVVSAFQRNKIIKGKILKYTDVGVFVELAPFIKGLVPKSKQISNLVHDNGYMQVKIMRIDEHTHKCYLVEV